MGKQTNASGSHFGGQWTKEKLTIIDEYLQFYTTAMSKQKVKLIYIDAFAGSGQTILSDGTVMDGSAIKALQYNFDEYYFIEINKKRIASLEEIIKSRYPEKVSKIHIIKENCNKILARVLEKLTVYQRGVMFLDPYALELDWSILEAASKTKILDVWYLFPVNALVRNLPKDKGYSYATSEKIDRILGTHDWEEALYKESKQLSLFETTDYERVDFEQLVHFVNKRLGELFPYVSPNSRILKNSKNSPLFILYFMMTNDSNKAIRLGSKVVNQIFSKVDSMAKEEKNEKNNKEITAI